MIVNNINTMYIIVILQDIYNNLILFMPNALVKLSENLFCENF